jgi:hypothetical protein
MPVYRTLGTQTPVILFADTAGLFTSTSSFSVNSLVSKELCRKFVAKPWGYTGGAVSDSALQKNLENHRISGLEVPNNQIPAVRAGILRANCVQLPGGETVQNRRI